jgi:ubiquinone/menaquinone biosynthesis C-methylase UbiE
MNPAHVFMVQERERIVLELFRCHGLSSLKHKTILEVGCGSGHWIREFVKWGARPENLSGIDLLPERVAAAKQVCPHAVDIRCGSGTELPFTDQTFDLVLQSTVFTSILDFVLKEQVAREMVRVLRSGGLVLWYDFHVNNPRNPDVCGVKRAEICRLFPGCEIQLQRITLAPPVTRWFARYSWLMCHLLSRIPLLCTHYLGVIRKG